MKDSELKQIAFIFGRIDEIDNQRGHLEKNINLNSYTSIEFCTDFSGEIHQGGGGSIASFASLNEAIEELNKIYDNLKKKRRDNEQLAQLVELAEQCGYDITKKPDSVVAQINQIVRDIGTIASDGGFYSINMSSIDADTLHIEGTTFAKTFADNGLLGMLEYQGPDDTDGTYDEVEYIDLPDDKQFEILSLLKHARADQFTKLN
jgi:hypothetical protein